MHPWVVPRSEEWYAGGYAGSPRTSSHSNQPQSTPVHLILRKVWSHRRRGAMGQHNDSHAAGAYHFELLAAMMAAIGPANVRKAHCNVNSPTSHDQVGSDSIPRDSAAIAA